MGIFHVLKRKCLNHCLFAFSLTLWHLLMFKDGFELAFSTWLFLLHYMPSFWQSKGWAEPIHLLISPHVQSLTSFLQRRFKKHGCPTSQRWLKPSSMFCCSFSSELFDLTLNVMQKVENSLSSEKKNKKKNKKRKKKPCLRPRIGASRRNTPSLEVFVWWPSLHMLWYSCYRTVVSKLKPNTCLTLREVNCMLAVWSGVKGPASGLWYEV